MAPAQERLRRFGAGGLSRWDIGEAKPSCTCVANDTANESLQSMNVVKTTGGTKLSMHR